MMNPDGIRYFMEPVPESTISNGKVEPEPAPIIKKEKSWEVFGPIEDRTVFYKSHMGDPNSGVYLDEDA